MTGTPYSYTGTAEQIIIPDDEAFWSKLFNAHLIKTLHLTFSFQEAQDLEEWAKGP